MQPIDAPWTEDLAALLGAMCQRHPVHHIAQAVYYLHLAPSNALVAAAHLLAASSRDPSADDVARLMRDCDTTTRPPWRTRQAEHHLAKVHAHLARHLLGEVIDVDSGRPALVHAATRACMAWGVL